MLPTLFRIPVPFTDIRIPIYCYGLMMATAFLVALYLIRRDARKVGLDPDIFGDGAFWTLIVGLAGTRILHIIMYPAAYSWERPLEWFAIWEGGLVFQGAIPAAFIFVPIYLRWHKTPLWKSVDLACPYMPLGHAIGRFGCFMNGCCYGKRTAVPWGIPFRRVPWDTSLPAQGSPAFLDHCTQYSELSINSDHWSFPVHATQLYSVLGLGLICLILLYLRRKLVPFPGALLCAYLFLYGAFRFIVEFFRGDHNPIHFGALSDQQLIALATSAAVLILALLLKLFFKHETDTSFYLKK